MSELNLVEAEVQKISTEPCKHNTFIYQLVDPPPFLWTQQCTYQPCTPNELISLTRRHLVLNHLPTEDRIFEAMAFLDTIPKPLFAMLTPAEVVQHKSQQKKDRYRRAFSNIRVVGERPSETNIRAFVKIEKWALQQMGVKAPRLIQYRSYEYCANYRSI